MASKGRLFQKELADSSFFRYDFPMISFEPNIETKGRIFRAAVSFLVFDLALAGFLLFGWPLWLCIPLFLVSFFVGFEAIRGWCLARACGMKTPF